MSRDNGAPPERERMDGDALLRQLTLIGNVLPPVEDLRAYIRASDRESAAAAVLYPTAWMRTQKRLPAIRKVCMAAIRYADAFRELQEAVLEESDPELDGPARDLLVAEQRKLRGGGS